MMISPSVSIRKHQQSQHCIRRTARVSVSQAVIALFLFTIWSITCNAAFTTTPLAARRQPFDISSLAAVTSSEEGSNNNGSNNLRPGSLAAATAEMGKVPYGESSRKYRRTVFTHQDWVDHRSSDRFVANLKSMFFSGIVRQIQKEVSLITLVGISVVVWNEYLSQTMDLPSLSLPSLPFTLSSPALGLLLVFRTNASYGRWLEGRKTWGRIITQSRNIIRMAATFTDTSSPEGREALDRLVRITWAFPRCLMNKLSGYKEDEKAFKEEMMQVFQDNGDSDFVECILSAEDRPVVAMMELSLALDAIPIDEKRRVEIDKSIVIMGDCLGSCERIFTSPVPLVYTRHTARFLSLWMLLLPFSLYDIFESDQREGWILIPAVAVLAVFLFGIEELSVQLEEPFTILPMQKFCDGIKSASETMRDRAIESKSAE